jgi:hypothetical protein
MNVDTVASRFCRSDIDPLLILNLAGKTNWKSEAEGESGFLLPRPVEKILLLFAYTPSMSRYDRPSHQVYMYFFKRGGWQVQFTEADLKTPLPRKLTFSDPEKIRELARRGDAWGTSEARQMLEHAIETGRGGIYLRLTPEQYARLRRP